MFKGIKILVTALFLVLFVNTLLFSQEESSVTEESGEGVITGEVVSLDTNSGTITIKKAEGIEKTFSVIEGETILWKGIEDVGLSDVKLGEEVEVGYYTDDTGKLIASWVDVLVTLKEAAPVQEDVEREQGVSVEEDSSIKEEGPIMLEPQTAVEEPEEVREEEPAAETTE